MLKGNIFVLKLFYVITNRYPINALHYSRFAVVFLTLTVLTSVHIFKERTKGEKKSKGRRQINNKQIKNLQPQLQFFFLCFFPSAAAFQE